MRRSLVFMSGSVLALALVSCSGEGGPVDPGGEAIGPPGLRVIAGAGVEDTITAVLPHALVIELRDESGRAIPDARVRFRSVASPIDGTWNVSVARLSSPYYSLSVVDTTDARGRAAVLVQLGQRAGPAEVSITALDLGLQASASYAVRAGAAATVVALPADSVVYVGGSYAVNGVVQDRFGNARDETVSFEVQAAGSPISLGAGRVRGERFGRGFVIASYGAIADTAWVSVVPPGVIAAYEPPRYFNSDGLQVVQPPRIVVLELDGSGFRVLLEQSPVEIPPGNAEGMHPRWAPSGNEIAFVSGGQVWAVNELGETRRVSAGPPSVRWDFPPEFGPDGTWIYVTTEDGPTSIWRLRADGSAAEALPVDNPQAASPAPAPSDERLAYQTIAATNHPLSPTIRILDLLSGERFPLDVPGQSPRWSPTGEWIAYVDYSDRLRLVLPDGTDRRLVGGGVKALGNFSWSPDGRWLLIAGSHATAANPFAVGLSLVEVSTGEVLPLRFGRSLLQPSWRK